MHVEWPEIDRYLPYSLAKPGRGAVLQPEEIPAEWGYLREGLVYLCRQDEQLNRQIWLIHRPGDILSPQLLTAIGGWYTVKRPAAIAWFSHSALMSLSALEPERVQGTLEAPARALAECVLLLRLPNLRARLTAWIHSTQALPRGTPPVPLADLADYLNADRSAMMREIARMKREGLIAGSGTALRLR